jgi:hypothetical protein
VDRVHGCENMRKIPGGRFIEHKEGIPGDDCRDVSVWRFVKRATAARQGDDAWAPPQA